MEINETFKALIPALAPEEFEQLKQNIINEGCRDAIVTWNGVIIDGHNRYKICTENNIQYNTIEKNFDTENQVIEWIILNQFGRRNLSNYQRSVLALRLEDLFRTKAKEKQIESGGAVRQKSDKPVIDTKKELAKIASVSHDTIAKVKLIEASAPEDIKVKLRTGEVSINQAYTELKKDKKKADREAEILEITKKIETENIIVNDVFDVIVIDPPWPYGRKYDPDNSRVANPYPEMSIDEIKNISLPIKNDAVVFLWTTHAFIQDSFDILNEWGMNYKAIITWDKELMGMGSTIRMQCEFCLLATKGSPIIKGNSERDIIRERRRQHSRKPDEFYNLVERMTIGNKLDYFSREQRQNWVSYGAETEKFLN